MLACHAWTTAKARDFEEERAARPFVFDYQSVHYIVRSKAPVTHGGVEIGADTPCEVQIRTILQHAYSELTHDTIYKPILSRSCFGTDRVWSRLGAVAPFNPVLLRGALKRLRSTPSASLGDLPTIAKGLLEEIVVAAASNWVTEEIPVFDKVVEIPSLRIDEGRLAALRQRTSS